MKTVAVAALLMAAALVGAQQPPQQVFRASADYVSTPVQAFDAAGHFVPGLTARDVQVFEDGVRQTITAFSASLGGRVMVSSAEAAPVREGLVTPPARKPETEGRIFIIFIDDLHIQFRDTARLKAALREVRDTVLHENDLVGIVSSGYSSIAFDLSPDTGHVRLNQAIDRVSGAGRTAQEIVNGAEGHDGPVGIRHDMFVTLKVAFDILEQAERVTDRRKAFIYVSSGYDFNPYKDARYQALLDLTGGGTPAQVDSGGPPAATDPITGLAANTQPIGRNPYEMNGLQFSDADLMAAIGTLVSRARIAGVQFWPLDPRGLVAGADISDNISATDHADHVNTTLSTLDVIAAGTGGRCMCRVNDWAEGLRELDNAMSDYYLVGYESTNHDPLRVHRRIEIKTTRPDVKSLSYRNSYNVRR
jgi:VWFA-related protein